MKKFDIVKLINCEPYKTQNLLDNMHGIMLETKDKYIDCLFFNPNNVGQCTIATISVVDVAKEKEELPQEIKQEILSKINMIKQKAKSSIEPIKIKDYDLVELTNEDEKYTKYGIHKGDTGCVMDSSAVQNYIEVDFSGVDEKGNYYGDCISVNIDDLKVIK